MKKEELETFSTEVLKKRLKAANSVLLVSYVLAALYVIYLLYTIIKGTWEPQAPQIIIPVLFLAVLLPTISMRKKIKEELKRRGQNQI
ncbi:MAG: hypothetical protein AUK33_07355 [Flavobacteriaceae bacterium CG2_30_34_30]|nr:hypothetical protein [Flavobacteriia bacterium]OIP50505.1 MAG: hypothetical protein AUK33_07355 [Flavobacteriaceae bacterium CG2_30_34_30]PIQ19170.1 MAG: hypothetical protein COW66_02370 [Flavobacteriaceae bacterium CG18_big_fil_WC_8_21_14_2_50_34_36]PIV50860.1 MAG: hypothetical protein COS19_03280 [Flavobacteriaceae bacterium CG02_land_8_20_14_3_00_34_13]PIZ08945.1 MAG: hypothetical protein COY56_01170 [Flavobacteriaceae bacterium CG_4_10_14_0_8_um_filter_34_31]PJC05994.1 MAG: hypothetical